MDKRPYQDDSVPYVDLLLEAQLNVDCDKGAKHHMNTSTRSAPTS